MLTTLFKIHVVFNYNNRLATEITIIKAQKAVNCF
ncbi:hypothetical protein predicted by Glimmer/Critica [Lactiplantibacillus plantarum]|nr:hypothetical protein predicted by Glimmer/Critica [Lactiplantibacillus plantarum]